MRWVTFRYGAFTSCLPVYSLAWICLRQLWYNLPLMNWLILMATITYYSIQILMWNWNYSHTLWHYFRKTGSEFAVREDAHAVCIGVFGTPISKSTRYIPLLRNNCERKHLGNKLLARECVAAGRLVYQQGSMKMKRLPFYPVRQQYAAVDDRAVRGPTPYTAV